MVINKGADFKGIGNKFHIDPVTARIIRNREVIGDDQKINEKAKIRIIGDYDIDGVMSSYILYRALTRCGAQVDVAIPNRITDGYGLNRNLITEALECGVDTILTCDNGIAAIEEIAYAKEAGMTVLVTDHHEIPFKHFHTRICVVQELPGRLLLHCMKKIISNKEKLKICWSLSRLQRWEISCP